MADTTELKESLRKLVRSDLRLQIFQKQAFSSDITPLLAFEQEYFQKLTRNTLELASFISDKSRVKELAQKIFKHELKRRIRIHERNINFHCPDCAHLNENDDNFICTKGVNPSKIKKCEHFDREDSHGWTIYVNNEKGRLEILNEILEKEYYLFDFSLLDK